MSQEGPFRHRLRKVAGKERIRVTESEYLPEGVESALPGEILYKKPATIDALRKASLQYLDNSAEEKCRNMKYVGEVVTKESVIRGDAGHARKISESKRRHKATDSDRRHRHRKVRVAEAKQENTDDERDTEIDDDGDKYVYPRRETRENTRTSAAEVPKQKVSTKSKDRSHTTRHSTTRRTRTVDNEKVHRDGYEASTHSKTRRTRTVKTENSHTTRRIPQRSQTEPVRRRNNYNVNECEPDHRTTTPLENPRPSLLRNATTIREKERPLLERSTTTRQTRPNHADTSIDHTRKSSSIFSNLLRPVAPAPEKNISCLTCGSDDVPVSKSAKLACSHRMCHDCLRRIFNMSVTDPAHMPPRCCTSEHIPLKHVEKLYDQKFKKNWNRKFLEYTTRNRIYCPARGCGEWIKPHHVIVENGRKVGKCKRCHTRVCCTCNNKMHTSRECPKDPATKAFVEIAKQEGWQRCFNCSAMVELKEGCNHMTCRCTAEFCMVCGVKWKGCDCPWFNYDAVGRNAGGDPVRYQEELDRRREQERRDAAFARRMQALGLEDDNDGGDEDTFGIGNAAGHHMNAHFVRNILAGNYQNAVREAEGLMSGAVNGRENPLPFMPLNQEQTAQFLRHPNRMTGGADGPAAPAVAAAAAGLPTRRNTLRQHRPLPGGGVAAGIDALLNNGGHPTDHLAAAEDRVRYWRNDVVFQDADRDDAARY